MIKAVIFDIGKVMVDFVWEDYLAQKGFTEEKKEILAKAVFENKTWQEADRGVWGDEQILESFVKVASQYRDDIINIWEELGQTIVAYPYAEAWVKELKEQGFKVYYLSNYGKTLRKKSKEQLSFTSLCDGGIFSYEVKCVKPEKKIYEMLLEKYHLVPEECVFFDDVPANIQAAREQGIHGIQIQSYTQAREEFERVLKEKNRDGLLLFKMPMSI